MIRKRAKKRCENERQAFGKDFRQEGRKKSRERRKNERRAFGKDFRQEGREKIALRLKRLRRCIQNKNENERRKKRERTTKKTENDPRSRSLGFLYCVIYQKETSTRARVFQEEKRDKSHLRTTSVRKGLPPGRTKRERRNAKEHTRKATAFLITKRDKGG